MESVRRRLDRTLGRVRRRTPDGPASGGRDIVITGPGRSGTTLTCHLLNKLPDTIALSEPMTPDQFADRLPDHEAVVDGIEDFYRRMRRMALKRGKVISKHVDGVVPDNTKGMVDGVRQRIAKKGKIDVGKELSPEFCLAIKQVGMYNALLPTLARRFSCFAIIRNPIAIRASSLSVKSQRKERRATPSALVRYDEGVSRRLEENKKGGSDAVDNWILRVHLVFERYQKLLPPDHIIRYEDIVASRGKALEVIVPAARELDEPLESQNKNPLYSRDKMLRYGERLLASEGAFWNFYTRESAQEILDGLA